MSPLIQRLRSVWLQMRKRSYLKEKFIVCLIKMKEPSHPKNIDYSRATVQDFPYPVVSMWFMVLIDRWIIFILNTKQYIFAFMTWMNQVIKSIVIYYAKLPIVQWSFKLFTYFARQKVIRKNWWPSLYASLTFDEKAGIFDKTSVMMIVKIISGTVYPTITSVCIKNRYKIKPISQAIRFL